MVINRLASVEEQKAYERLRIEEAKRNKAPVKSLDAQPLPVVDQGINPDTAGVQVAGQVVDTAKYQYARIKVRGPDGVAHYTAGNHDAVAKSLFGMSKEQLLVVAELNGLDMKAHFKVRNGGHFRMIVGQALRSIVTRGATILINDVEIKSLGQKVKWPKGYHEEEKGTAENPIRKAGSAHRIKG